ncbi:MAG: DUF302 domain-containing protein [Gammaproteobacteria bacterium]
MKQHIRRCVCIIAISLSTLTWADSSVFEFSTDRPIAEIYDKLYKSLEDARLYVVFEPDIGKNLSGFADRWGENYNRNELSAIRSMVFCNGWYANQVSNQDPRMLAFCPLHLTLIEKDGRTTALFTRPTVFAANSPAKETLAELEKTVITAIREGMSR